MNEITIIINPDITNNQLNLLFSNAWLNHSYTDFTPNFKHCLLYVCVFFGEELIGYVTVAWDGGKHGFLLDPTVHKNYQHQGIGTSLVKYAIQAAKEKGLEWIHVDYEPHLHEFYSDCGFTHTEAGLINLKR